MTNRSDVDWAQVERDFITGSDEVSLRALAVRESVSNSTVSTHAKQGGWLAKRAEYRKTETEEYIHRSARENAERLARLADRSVDVLEAMLVRVADGLVNGTLQVSGKDALDAVKLIQLLRGEPTERHEGRELHAHVFSPEALDALDALARSKLEPRRVGDSPVKLLTG